MRATGTSSSSATICRSAVDTPVPSSTLPAYTVMRSSRAMTSHESSWSAAGAVAVERLPNAPALASRGASVNPMTNTPVLLRNSRRETLPDVMLLMSALPSGWCRCAAPGRPSDRAHDAHVRAASTQVRRERRRDLIACRARRLREQGCGAHDHPVHAVAALRGLLVDERLLQRVRTLGCPKSLECDDLLAHDGRDVRHAGASRGAVNVNGARAALAEPAAESRTVEGELVAEHVEQRRVRFGSHVVLGAIDANAHDHHARCQGEKCSARMNG